MHKEALEWIGQALEEQLLDSKKTRGLGRVLEFGSRNVNGGARGLFTVERWHGIDLVPGEGVDEVADAASWLVKEPGTWDVVVCTEVLEHAGAHAHDQGGVAHHIIRKAWEALRPGGVFLMTAACDPRAPHSAKHGGPLEPDEYYKNVDAAALAWWMKLAGWKRYRAEWHHDRGDVYARAEK